MNNINLFETDDKSFRMSNVEQQLFFSANLASQPASLRTKSWSSESLQMSCSGPRHQHGVHPLVRLLIEH